MICAATVGPSLFITNLPLFGAGNQEAWRREMRKLAERLKPVVVDTGRRRLMTGAVTVGAAAGLGLTSVNAQAAPAVEQEERTKPVGYHETDHIRRYYRSAREI
ncbi:MAG: hypothetical protein V2J42_14870 [Wenzhouxiangella sp.]|jgi:hypothetical protein|nr:hypothetical protein [Wenzhouxiangella sp.]